MIKHLLPDVLILARFVALALMLASCPLRVAAALAAGYSIPIVELANDTDRQVIVDREMGQYLGHPATVLLEDGKTILCVYPKGHGRGAIQYQRSTDGGRTWSGRLPVPENWATSQETPTIHRVVDAAGKKRLIVWSGRYPARLAVSEDDGKSWSPLKQAGDWGGIVVMGSLEPVRGRPGHYLAWFHDDGRYIRKDGKTEKPVVFRLYQVESRDGGLTWGQPRELFVSSEVHLCEPGVVRSPDGKQMAMLLRENSRRRNSHVMFSDDEGATWTTPRELPAALTGDRHTGKYAPDGRLFLSFRDTTRESVTRGDWVGWVGTYEDIVRGSEGQYRVRIMDNTKDYDCAYPGVEVLPGGTFVTTTYGHWTQGQPPYVASVRFTLAQLDVKLRDGATVKVADKQTAARSGNDIITLHASNAVVHGTMMRYEPQTNKNCLGYWTKAEDWADWTFEIPQAGSFEIEIWQGCGKGQGGSDVAVEVGGKRFDFVVEDTGHFQNFTPRRLGRVELTAGRQTLAVKPQRKQAAAVMDIRRVRLLPVNPLPAGTEATKAMLGGKRVVILGDSITHAGDWIDYVEAYLRLQSPGASFDSINLGLPSETVSGLSEPGHAGGQFPRPDLHERLDRVLAKLKPDVIVACYGMNDGIYYPFGEERFAAFQSGMRRLREKASAAGAKVIHVTPPTFDSVPIKVNTLPAGREEYRQPYEGYNDVLDRYSEWLVAQRVQGWQVIDAHGPMNRFLAGRRADDSRFKLAGDGVHANQQGHWLIAREFLRSLGIPDAALAADSFELATLVAPTAPEVLDLVKRREHVLRDAWLSEVGHKRPGMGKGKPAADAEREAAELEARLKSVKPPRYPGKRSVWNGFDRYDFEVDGKPVLVVAPKSDAPGRPWVWHGEFFGHKPAPDIALLERGFHVVYMSVPDMLGSPQAVAHWNVFYKELTEKHGFAKKAALVGLSRGGLYCYNWATASPDKVACIYADAPVCDFKSWPGAFGKAKRSDRDWQLVLNLYGFKSDEEAKAYSGNPVDSLAPLAAAKVPLLHVYGDADEVVPWDENTGLVAERYRKLGGSITLIVKPGVKHHPHGLDDSTPIVKFIWDNAASKEAKAWLVK